MNITGENYIAGERTRSGETFRAREAASGEPFGEEFYAATKGDVERACHAAAEAQQTFGSLPSPSVQPSSALQRTRSTRSAIR